MNATRSSEPLRSLSVEELGLEATADTSVDDKSAEYSAISPLDNDDKVLMRVREAIGDGFAGIIFSGPPGTSKSEYAARIAYTLADGDGERVRFIQFHPSFQYEDFVEGFIPKEAGGFELKAKHFRNICETAAKDRLHTYVLVIDEISRCDAARVFGEALTYIESSKRDMEFALASGTVMSIPKNLVILATMNPWDRGVDEVDIALERRFAHIDMPPDPTILQGLLSSGDFSAEQLMAITRFFEAIQRLPNRFFHIGHAYFARAKDRGSLIRLWDLQLKHHFLRACRSNANEFGHVETLWNQLVLSAFAAPQFEVKPVPGQNAE